MKKFTVDFNKTIWGFVTVNAEDREEALRKFDDGDWDDEFENKSDYEFGKIREE